MANEAGQGCQALSALDNYSWIDGSNLSEAGNVTKLRTQKSGSVAAGEVSYDFGDVNGTPEWTSTGENPDGNPFTMGVDVGCYEETAGVDFTQFSVSANKSLGVWQTENVQYTLSGANQVWYNNGTSLLDQAGLGVTSDSSGDTGFGADISAAGGLSIPIVIHHRRHG